MSDSTQRKRMSVRSLRRGMYVMAICGDDDEPDFNQVACPTLVVRVDRRDEQLTGVELCNPRTGSALGMGHFENDAVAWIATAADRELLNGSPSSADDEEPLGCAVSQSATNVVVPPTGWPRFPTGAAL